MALDDVDSVEFVGGPLDGLRQSVVTGPPPPPTECVAIPVNENVVQMLSGLPAMPRTRATSVAIYEFETQPAPIYRFLSAAAPQEFNLAEWRC